MTADHAVRHATEADLDALAALAASEQNDPTRHCLYLGLDAASIAVDVSEVEDWTDYTFVLEADGALAGWLLAEVDADMGRVWWWGPFVSGADWAGGADALLAAGRSSLPDIFTEHEAAADARSDLIRSWAERNGFRADPASVMLLRQPDDVVVADPRVRPLDAADHQAVIALHDLAFPGTHTTGAALVAADDPRLVIELDGVVVGYVAYEVQSDNSGYIDYLAVEADRRSGGLGGALVQSACADLFDRGVSHAHLTVREANASARALYARVGFTEERIAVPYRLGFELL